MSRGDCTQFHESTHVGVGHEHGYEDHMFVLFYINKDINELIGPMATIANFKCAITAIKTNLHQERATKKEDCFTYHL